MRAWSTIAAAAMLGCLCAANTGTARAEEVVLMTTGAVEQIMKGLIPSFERATGHKVSMSVYGTGPAVAKIKEGSFADLILLGPDAFDELAAAGKVNAIHQIAELLPIAGIDIIGDLPADLNKTIVYATGLTPMVKHPDAANALVKYLSLPSSVPVIQQNGMNPVDLRR